MIRNFAGCLALVILGISAGPAGAQGGCLEDEATLCLHQGRFQVRAVWHTDTGDQGLGHQVRLSDDSGYFWFFQQGNVELVAKVLDACTPPFDHYWVFLAGLTDVEVDVTVVDTRTGMIWLHHNPMAQPFPPVQDTAAFATCNVQDVLPGVPFPLQVGQMGRVEAAGLTVHFSGVIADSRCPSDVVCVWEGDAEIEVELLLGGQKAALRLHTHGGEGFPQEASALGWTVRLEALEPQPLSTQPIDPRAYVATLRVEAR